MLNELLLNIIWFCHVLVICFIVGIPFFGSYYFLFMHVIFVPFIIFHWLLNDNTCVLTLMEFELRKKLGHDIKKEDCFTSRLINPVYDFTQNYNDWSLLIYIITIFLWLIAVFKLYNGYMNGNIKNLLDLLYNKY